MAGKKNPPQESGATHAVDATPDKNCEKNGAPRWGERQISKPAGGRERAWKPHIQQIQSISGGQHIQ